MSAEAFAQGLDAVARALHAQAATVRETAELADAEPTPAPAPTPA